MRRAGAADANGAAGADLAAASNARTSNARTSNDHGSRSHRANVSAADYDHEADRRGDLQRRPGDVADAV